MLTDRPGEGKHFGPPISAGQTARVIGSGSPTPPKIGFCDNLYRKSRKALTFAGATVGLIESNGEGLLASRVGHFQPLEHLAVLVGHVHLENMFGGAFDFVNRLRLYNFAGHAVRHVALAGNDLSGGVAGDCVRCQAIGQMRRRTSAGFGPAGGCVGCASMPGIGGYSAATGVIVQLTENGLSPRLPISWTLSRSPSRL